MLKKMSAQITAFELILDDLLTSGDYEATVY